ncbi:MAG: KamA family radical SAM protein [Deltaproteobacteria bacterium]|nr:KamA family radical SAM protein [Deltaproteobacteria bacterium]
MRANGKPTHLNDVSEAAGPKPARLRSPAEPMGAPHRYDQQSFLAECQAFLYPLKICKTIASVRGTLRERLIRLRVENSMYRAAPWDSAAVRSRDCTRTFLTLIAARSDQLTEFSVTQALWDVARGMDRPDLGPGFFAEMTHLVRGIEDRAVVTPLYPEASMDPDLSGRKAAILRSYELDELWKQVQGFMDRFEHGLTDEAIARRRQRREELLTALGGTQDDWDDWRWHLEHVRRDAESLDGLVQLSAEQRENIVRTCKKHIPFGVTPFYLGLMDGESGERDRAIRAQVFPPTRFVDKMAVGRDRREEAFDFMGELDTSPVDLVTRRYPGIAILKPYNTCPQICVYCQRNWEIDEVLAPDAMAPWDKIREAVKWIGQHPAIHEVLITGGDPFLLGDGDLARLLDLVSALPTVRRIRIGTRTPVTLPMRITEELAALLGSYRITTEREVCVVTHVQHPYEVNPEMADACERLRMQGIPIYNQLVYTYYVSRRFEAALLKRLLRRVGIDPYYTFLPKGKAETDDYRVPLSRLLQEEAEEARLMPGVTRTDEAVYNVPRLGKNYLRATQHRDLLTILPDGTRVYEFHPWEKNIVEQTSYIGEVVPILDYLERLREDYNEDPRDYESIWYYF